VRTLRRQTLSRYGEQTLFISNSFAFHVPAITLEGRELTLQFMMESAEKNNIEILAWCLMPTSYRIILNTPGGFSNRKTEQSNPLVVFSKIFQQRFASWMNHAQQVPGTIWKDRYASSSLASPGELVAGALSVVAFPLFTHIADDLENYYFTSYFHACAGDNHARQGISTLMGMPDASWARVKRRLCKHINSINSIACAAS